MFFCSTNYSHNTRFEAQNMQNVLPQSLSGISTSIWWLSYDFVWMISFDPRHWEIRASSDHILCHLKKDFFFFWIGKYSLLVFNSSELTIYISDRCLENVSSGVNSRATCERQSTDASASHVHDPIDPCGAIYYGNRKSVHVLFINFKVLRCCWIWDHI